MLDSILIKIKSNISGQKVVGFEISGDGTLRYLGRLCIRDVDGL